MKTRIAVCLLLLLTLLACSSAAFAQGTAQAQNSTQVVTTDTQEKNLQEYIDLLRSDIRQQKSQIVGAVMLLDVDQATKFWPIYAEYDAELRKLNDQRVANIKEYARNYDNMTDAKADELIQKAMNYRKQRAELLAKYYVRVKEALGAVEAARFVQIEDQLLMIIDLQISSSLPIVEQGS